MRTICTSVMPASAAPHRSAPHRSVAQDAAHMSEASPETPVSTASREPFLAPLYRRLRWLLPTATHVRLAGVPAAIPVKVGERGLLRAWAPKPLDDIPTYEAALVKALHAHVMPGDRVVVVGGGWGVTTAIAARLAGDEGHVTCYEASKAWVERSRGCLALQPPAATVEIHHAVVGPLVQASGDEEGARNVAATDLPVCDVLEMDCEGAEIPILAALPFRPRALLVESHGFLGSPSKRVMLLLKTMGYTIEHIEPAEPRLQHFCEEHDVMVVTARYQSAG